MTLTGRGRAPLRAGALVLGIAASASVTGQSPAAFPGTLDEHPAIGYAQRPPSDRVARLDEHLAAGTVSLMPDARTGYLLPVLKALDIPVESQLLVFSKTGLQRPARRPRRPMDRSDTSGTSPSPATRRRARPSSRTAC